MAAKADTGKGVGTRRRSWVRARQGLHNNMEKLAGRGFCWPGWDMLELILMMQIGQVLINQSRNKRTT